jgi:hypothetical protein
VVDVSQPEGTLVVFLLLCSSTVYLNPSIELTPVAVTVKVVASSDPEQAKVKVGGSVVGGVAQMAQPA